MFGPRLASQIKCVFYISVGMAECGSVRLADVVLRFEGDSSLVCHCTKLTLSLPINMPKADRDKSNDEVSAWTVSNSMCADCSLISRLSLTTLSRFFNSMSSKHQFCNLYYRFSSPPNRRRVGGLWLSRPKTSMKTPVPVSVGAVLPTP